MRENYPIADIPIPDFSDWEVEDYLYENRPITMIVTSRGCPHSCSFCSVHRTFGKTYRRRTNEDILNEIDIRYQQGIRVFDFEDDNFTFNKKAAKDLCQRLSEKYSTDPPQYLAMNGISYMSLDEELIGLMRKAGFTHLNLSLVSLNEHLIKKQQRPHSPQRVEKVVLQAHKHGFKTVLYQIIGLPGETIDSMVDTLIFAAEMPVLLGPSMFYPTPGIPSLDEVADLNITDRLMGARLTAMAVESSLINRDEIYTLFVVFRIINFLKSCELEQDQMDLSTSLNWFESQGGRAQIGSHILKSLLNRGVLFQQTKKAQIENNHFQMGFFKHIWKKTDFIKTQKGSIIKITPHSLF